MAISDLVHLLFCERVWNYEIYSTQRSWLIKAKGFMNTSTIEISWDVTFTSVNHRVIELAWDIDVGLDLELIWLENM